jgi:uncharacterized protein (TIGR02145 family)
MKTLFMSLIVILFSINVFPQIKVIHPPVSRVLICRATIVSYAGQTYHTVQIGGQCWLKENLNVGTMIKGSVDQKKMNSKYRVIGQSTIEKYCYNDDPANCTNYGGLYQWAEAVQFKNGATNTTSPSPAFTGNIQGICPIGWHIPTEAEFVTLKTTEGGDGNKLKDTRGFSALMSGGLTKTVGGNWRESGGLGKDAEFWSSSERDKTHAAPMYLGDINTWDHSGIQFYPQDKANGYSVRCVQD